MTAALIAELKTLAGSADRVESISATIPAPLLRRTIKALYAYQAQIAEMQADHAEMVSGKVIMSQEAFEALSAQQAGENWRPIESAPKDGTHVWLGWPKGAVTLGRWWDGGPLRFGAEWETGLFYREPGCPIPNELGEPSHWQPYVRPPAPRPVSSPGILDNCAAPDAGGAEAIADAVKALSIFLGHDSRANLVLRYGEKWWERVGAIRDALKAAPSPVPVGEEEIAAMIDPGAFASVDELAIAWRKKIAGLDLDVRARRIAEREYTKCGPRREVAAIKARQILARLRSGEG